MAEENIKRYTMEQIREMNRRGEFAPPHPDAPEFEIDDDFWENALPLGAERPEKKLVVLELAPGTVEHFQRGGADHLERMARVLEEAATGKAKP